MAVAISTSRLERRVMGVIRGRVAGGMSRRSRAARLVPVRAWLAPRIAQGRHWLSAPRPLLTWAALVTKLTILKLPSTYFGRLAALAIIVLLLLPLWLWYAQPQRDGKGAITYPHASLIN